MDNAEIVVNSIRIRIGENVSKTKTSLGTVLNRDYYREREKKWVWVFLKVDKKKTRIVDLDDFCALLFPNSIRKRQVARAIIELFVERKRPLYLREMIPAINQKSPASNQTISDTYKAMFRAGLLTKRYRNDPTSISTEFSNRLQTIAEYWVDYLKAKGLIS